MGTRHVVRQGECLIRIAKQYGFGDYHEIYDHSNNAEFRKKRPDPDVISPGDVIAIPEKKSRTEHPPTTRQSVYEVPSDRRMLRLRLLDDEGNPRAAMAYKLTVDGVTLGGKTDADGKLNREIALNAVRGLLEFAGESIELQLWHLDPVEELTGVQGRLKNMGYYHGNVDGITGPMTEGALRLFQRDQGLPETGKLSADTRKALQERHGK